MAFLRCESTHDSSTCNIQPERKLKPMHGVGKARDPGGGSCSLSSTTSSSRRQCDGGGGSGLFSNCDSFISSVSCLLCQPPFWGCQSRPKLVPQEAEAAKADGD